MKWGWLIAGVCGISMKAAAKPAYRLAPPVLLYPSAFFTDSVEVTVLYDQPGTISRYTLDGSEPGPESPVCGRRLVIRESCRLSVRNFGKGFLPGMPAQVAFTRAGVPLRAALFTPPAAAYSGGGSGVLTDGKGGTGSHTQPGWLGFQTDSVVVEISAMQPLQPRRLIVNTLVNTGAWIFLPDSIRVYDAMDPAAPPLASFHPEGTAAEGAVPLTIPLDARRPITRLRLVLYPVQKIMAGHPGAGKPGWLFIDEILLYP